MSREFVSEVSVPVDQVDLEGTLTIPENARGVVIFAHGSGSSRHSPRNRFVAESFRAAGIGTLLFDLLSADEESIDIYTRHLRFDIRLLADRLVQAAKWLRSQPAAEKLDLGFFGASTGGGAALVAAAELDGEVSSVVSRGGRPDLAGDALAKVDCPVLLIVGELDDVVIQLNRAACDRLRCEKELAIIPGATHLFEEPGTLEAVAELAAGWFTKHFGGSTEPRTSHTAA